MGALSIRSIAETVCLVPTSTLDGSSTPSEINCTDDGETWSPVDLTP